MLTKMASLMCSPSSHVVNEILSKEAENDVLSKSINVDKLVEVEIDEGTLLATDYNTFDTEMLRTKTEEYLKSLTRDNVQLLVNKIWDLPTEHIDEIFVAKLPKSKFILPRARAVPKPKPLTKWQQFAKEKGINSKKKGKSKLQWDNELSKWVPKFGYQRTKAVEQKDWLIELGDDNTAKTDPRETLSRSKQERVAKNELQRLRNLAKSKNIKVPRVGLPTTEQFASAKHLATATTIAGEVQHLKKKRKIPPLSVAEEKKRNTTLVDGIVSKKSKKDILQVENIRSVASDLQNLKPERKQKYNGKSSSKKPNAGRGKRDLHVKVSGRKRRS